MLEFIRPHLEAEAAQRGRESLLQLRAAQTRNKAYWVLHLFSSISGLIVLMVGLSVADRVQSWRTHITIVVVLLTVVLVAVGEWQRSLRSALRLAGLYLQFRQRVAQRLASDYLATYAWATYLFVIVPGLSFLFLVILTTRGQWSLVVRKNSSVTCKTQKSQGFVVVPDPAESALAFLIERPIE